MLQELGTRPMIFLTRIGAWASVCLMAGIGSPRAGGSFLAVYRAGAGAIGETFCIGEEESDDYMLGQPFIDVDSRGNIFVLDTKLHQIMKFDSNGAYIRTFSQPGEGPGDMGTLLVRMAVAPDGRVVIADYVNARLTEFTNEGEYVRNSKFNPMMAVTRMAFGRDGTLFLETQRPVTDRMDTGEVDVALIQVNRELESIGVVDSMRVVQFESVEKSGDRVPYPRELVWDVTPAGELVIGWNDEYRFDVFSPDLKVLRTIQNKVDPVEVGDDDRKRFAGKARNDELRSRREKMHFPRHKPPIAGLRVDHEGYLLVCLSDDTDSRTLYDVYDPGGNHVRSAVLPPLDRLQVLRGGSVYFVDRLEEAPPKVCRSVLVVSQKQ